MYQSAGDQFAADGGDWRRAACGTDVEKQKYTKGQIDYAHRLSLQFATCRVVSCAGACIANDSARPVVELQKKNPATASRDRVNGEKSSRLCRDRCAVQALGGAVAAVKSFRSRLTCAFTPEPGSEASCADNRLASLRAWSGDASCESGIPPSSPASRRLPRPRSTSRDAADGRFSGLLRWPRSADSSSIFRCFGAAAVRMLSLVIEFPTRSP